MTHYHDYCWDTCNSTGLTSALKYISQSGYKLIAVTETACGHVSYFTLFYDRKPEDKEN